MTVLDKNDIIQNVFHIGDQMGGNEDGGILIVIVDDSGKDIISCSRVNTGNRLIQAVQACSAAQASSFVAILLR